MMTSWYGNAFLITGSLWGEPPVIGGFPSQRVSNVSFDTGPNMMLNIQSSCRDWETMTLIWRHCDDKDNSYSTLVIFPSGSETISGSDPLRQWPCPCGTPPPCGVELLAGLWTVKADGACVPGRCAYALGESWWWKRGEELASPPQWQLDREQQRSWGCKHSELWP